ncbi:MAG: LytTR family transcriptional regulator [Eubacteriales bacterium]|nr:LytTR family transcriptional regulator [Eubacteriales bacterium]
MKYRSFTTNEVLNLTKDALHLYFQQDLDTFSQLLDEEFVWIGSYDFHYTSGKDVFLHVSRMEPEKPPARITQEEYHLLVHSGYLWVVYGRFAALAWQEGEVPDHRRMRITLVWRQEKNDLRLLHVNCSPSADAPMDFIPSIRTPSEEEIQWYQYIRQAAGGEGEGALIRDLEGSIHCLTPEEILYVNTRDKTSAICTRSGSFLTHRSLTQLSLELPQLIQVHKSWLVNPAYVSSIRRYTVTLTQGTQVPVGKNRYNDVRERLSRR